jgi:hypothetical protein
LNSSQWVWQGEGIDYKFITFRCQLHCWWYRWCVLQEDD